METDGTIPLNGEWNFYWNQFVTFEDINAEKSPKASGLIQVPKDWNYFEFENKKIKNYGFGTYTLKVKNISSKNLYLHIPPIGTAYKLFINDSLIVNVGNTGKNIETHKSRFKLLVLALPETRDEFQITLQVSNFSYEWGGIFESIKIGNLDNINSDKLNISIAEGFLCGVLSIMGLYHLGIYLHRRKNNTALYFSLVCFSGMARVLSIGQHLLIDLIPNIEWESLIKVEFSSMIFSLYFFYMYIYSLFKKYGINPINNLILICISIFLLLILSTDPLIFSKYLGLMQLLILLTIIYIFYVLFRALFNKEEFVSYILLILIVFFNIVIFDILKSNLNLNFPYISSWGVIFFILAQSYILSVRSSRAFDKIRELSIDLEKRTEELELSYQNISDLNRLFNSLNESLDLETIMNKVMKYMEERYHMSYFLLGVLREDGITAKIEIAKLPEFVSIEDRETLFKQTPVINKGKGTHSYSFRSREPLFINKVQLKDLIDSEKLIFKIIEAKSIIIIPLTMQNQIVGFLDFWRDSNFHMSSEELTRLSILGEQISGIIYSSNLFKNIEEERNKAKKAYFELEASQKQLVQSDRMITLGTLVAGVAHEINSPLGAIKATSENILENINELMIKFLEAFPRMNLKDWELVFELTEKSKNIKMNYSTKESRLIRKTISSQLADLEVKESEQYAEKIFDLGFQDYIEYLKPHIYKESFKDVLQTVSILNGIRKKAGVIDSSASRVSKIVKSLKSFMHFDEKDEMILSDLSDGMETVLTILHNQLKQGIDVIRNYEPIPSIYCYPDELNQIWTNLIHNSIQAMNGKGTIILDLKQIESQEGRQIQVSVEDNGPGIPPEIQKKIFEPFFTTKPAGEGSGLGLHIIGKILEKHRGKISLESEAGRTKFTILIPARLEI
ncbi:MAG: GHKL domain-containing protein [Spirochaetia bacterium]|nr:GHKL domain-containing protein [Spirochaetia bacterium]